MAYLRDLLVTGTSRFIGKVYAQQIIGNLTGNSDTASKLSTARSINGTSFDGSSDITTNTWGTARQINISSSDGSNPGNSVSVNGSSNVTLKLPATIKASLTGNADSATKLATARTIALTGSVTGSGSFDGSGNLSITTATNHTHNYAGSNSAGGNALKLNLPREGSDANWLPDTGGTMQMRELTNTSSNLPEANFFQLIANRSEDGRYGSQLAMGMTTNKLYFRNYHESTFSSWREVAFTDSSSSPTSSTAKFLDGFIMQTGTGWGVQTGEYVHGEETNDGCAFKFNKNCPSSGKLSMIIDGNFYQNEGNYMCLDTNNFSSYALPLSGGTMTGDIKRNGNAVVNTGTDGSTNFSGGTNLSNGAVLVLRGSTQSGIEGRFELGAIDSSSSKYLIGNPSGGLTWAGNPILTSSNYSSYALPLTGGTVTGSLKVNGGLNIGDKVVFWSDNEGGNIRWYSPEGVQWEFDCFDENFRLFNYNSYKNFRITRDEGDVYCPGDIYLKGSTVSSNAYGSSNPTLTFCNSDSSQNVSLIFTDYDSVQAPASLTFIGNQGGEYFIAPNIKATGSFYGSLSGNASTATKLTTSAGSTAQPVYFSDGKPVACDYSLASMFSDINMIQNLVTNLLTLSYCYVCSRTYKSFSSNTNYFTLTISDSTFYTDTATDYAQDAFLQSGTTGVYFKYSGFYICTAIIIISATGNAGNVKRFKGIWTNDSGSTTELQMGVMGRLQTWDSFNITFIIPRNYGSGTLSLQYRDESGSGTIYQTQMQIFKIA